jgi:hypothetical protein
MSLVDDCVECRGLWMEYSVATREHIRLKGKLAVAALSHDPDAVRTLTSGGSGSARPARFGPERVRPAPQPGAPSRGCRGPVNPIVLEYTALV